MGEIERTRLTVPRKTLPRILAVAADALPMTLRVHWDTSDESRVDVSSMIESFRLYAPLRQSPEMFRQVQVGEYGTDVVWPEGIDMSADTLWRLAQEQAGATMTADEFRQWRARKAYTLDAAAKALGVSRRMVAYYEQGDRAIPRVVALATRASESEPITSGENKKRQHGIDLDSYSRSRLADYAAFADTVASILRTAILEHPQRLRLQQVQHRAKSPESLRKKLENRGILATTSLEDEIKDLAGCRLIFYTNSDVSRFIQSGIIEDNFEVDWDRAKIHHPIPGKTTPDNLFRSYNYVLKLNADRTTLPEYACFKGLRCEVQVQTTLNHAWSEMAHDTIYKKPRLEGFGGKLFEAIDQRFRKIMKDHLLPAGYEFQKVQDDYERLLSGKSCSTAVR